MATTTTRPPGFYYLYGPQHIETPYGIANGVLVTPSGEVNLARVENSGPHAAGGMYFIFDEHAVELKDVDGNYIPAPENWDKFRPDSFPQATPLEPNKF